MVYHTREISIHAPVWGRGKIRAAETVAADLISIHAPVWGRAILRLNPQRFPRISIHAPVWGRVPIEGLIEAANEFQFTPPCGGGRPAYTSITACLTIFQFTPPCGGGPVANA